MSDADVRASTYNVAGMARKFRRHMPTKKNSNIDWDKICDAAAIHGVAIWPDGSFIALHKKPTKKFLLEMIKGPYKIVKIPSEGLSKDNKGRTTVILCKDTALKTAANSTASYLALIEMYGVCVWLPEENVK